MTSKWRNVVVALAVVLAIGVGIGAGYAIWGGSAKPGLIYDDGKPDGFGSQGPGWGYSVRFSPPATPFTISKVKLVAGLRGTEYADQKASLEIWDENLEVLYSREMLATEFSPEIGWVTVDTNITVDGDFRVVFFTNWGGQEGSIIIGYDSSSKNKHSEVVRTGGLLADWPPPMEETKPEATTNLMLRVIVTPTL